MNRKCYRIIFNKKRGLLMVVAATSASMMALPAANGQIVADPNAPSNQRPTIVDTGNGLPQVNIQAPSAAGVSRNTYSRFDVQQAGAILNNARNDVQTQLGGWIQGNANLTGGSARIILNEVNSADPSYLRGHLEVAGDRAQVVIANPSGVSCDGCGFINASRATLTSGTPIMNGGSLEGFRVQRGTVSVEGAGLDARDTDYADIIGQAVKVNAGIWGKTLKVTAGANQVDAANTRAVPIDADAEIGGTPAIGIDVAQLGGMYANKIILIGTGAGVGVRNAGEIGAAAGDVIVQADGTLANSGRIDSTQGISLAAQTLDNRHGQILAAGDVELDVARKFDNGGGRVSAGKHLAIGDIEPVKALRIENDGGELIAGLQLDIDAAGLDGNGKLLSDKDMALKLDDEFINAGTIEANGKLALETSLALVNQGKLRAGDTLSLKAAKIDNRRDAEMTAAHLGLKTDSVLENRGLIDAKETFIDADAVNNVGSGRLYGDHIAIQAAIVGNTAERLGDAIDAPIIAARDRLDIAAETIDNRSHAMLLSDGDMAIGGALDDNRHAIGQAGRVDNHSATIEAAGALDLSAREINNINDHFSTELVEVSRRQIREYQPAGSPNRYRADQVRIEPHSADSLVSPEGNSWKFNRYDYTRVVQETKIKETDPAKILSGGAMQITADALLNDKSMIMAGGDLKGDIGKLLNTDAAGQRIISDQGTATYFYRIKRWWWRDKQGRTVSGYNPAAAVQKTSLAPAVYKQHAKGQGSGMQIATRDISRMDVPVVLPDSSLFIIDADPGLNYVVQTDPRFTDRRNWLSSDYYLQKMKSDPAAAQKRLGDGYYEQKLIREQVAELTGRRFLDGYADDEEQYRALLDSGAAYAKKLNLRIGVALSARQMAELTNDVVLLVEKDVALPGGKRGKVLVPQLYTRIKRGGVNGAGALMSGDAVDLQIHDNALNSGTIFGRDKVLIEADAGTVGNVGGRISAADVRIAAAGDIDNIGGTIDAADRLELAAGRDLNIVSSTEASQGAQGRRTNISSVAALSVANDKAVLIASAGRDANLNAAQIINGGKRGETSIAAGNDLNLGTVTESATQSLRWDADNHRSESNSLDIGSMIATVGDLNLQAGHDLNARAAEVVSDAGAIAATAGNDINLRAGSSRADMDESHKTKGSSGWFATKTVRERDRISRTEAQGSAFSGNTVALQSGNDINVAGSDVVSTLDATLAAGRDVNIEAAVDIVDETHVRKEQTSGLFSGGGIGFTIGTKGKDSTGRRMARSASGSSIGSTDGNLDIRAGAQYRQSGSQLLTPKGNVDIAAKRVDIVAAADTERNSQETVARQSGLSISITNPVIAAVQTVHQIKAASKKTKDQRMQGLAAAASALTIANTQDMVAASAAPAGGIDLAISIGGSKSVNRSEQSSALAHGSRIAAGGSITIAAIDGGADSDLTIQGSDIAAGKNIVLRADDEVNLLAADNVTEQHSSNKGGSASIGVSIGTSGFMVNAGLSGNIGRGDGSDLIRTNTHIDAGKNLTIESGTDTNIVGAVASGKKVAVEVGTSGAGDLNIASLQDSSNYKSNQQSLGGSISVGWGKMSGSISAAQSKVDGKYRSVSEQSGITAGDGGFDVVVHGNTHIEGGKIASTDKAAKNGKSNKNSFTTETLTQGDIDNHSDHKASSWNISAGGGYSGAGSAMNGTGIGHGNSSGSDSTVTRAGISNASMHITDDRAQQAKTGRTAKEAAATVNTDVSTDRDTSGKLTKGWNGEQLQEEVTAQSEITAAFGKESSKAIGTYATDKENDLRRQAQAARKRDPALARELDEEAQKWSEYGAYRTAMHAASGGLAGGIGGAAGAMGSAKMMPKLNEMIDQLDVPNVVKQGLSQVTAGALGAVIGGMADLAGSLNVEANNRQLHHSEAEMIEKNAARFAKVMYGAEHPDAEQIAGAAAILSNTAQYLLDNNLGYTVPHSKQAEAFLQTLQSEYSAVSPNLSIGDGQYLFYATPDQRSDARLNVGDIDKPFSDLIAKTPVKQIEDLPRPDHRRDVRTGLPLDEQGRYSEQAYVNGNLYQPKYFPCASIECQDHNLDMSDPGTQAYVKAIDRDILEKIGTATNVAILANPVGAIGVTTALVGSAAGLAGGVIDDSLPEAIATEMLEYGAEMYMRKVYGLPKAVAVRAVTLIDSAGGWDAFVERTSNYLFSGRAENGS
ncbi:MAG TPA: hemagglutinin repeat-containing protein [Herbaspirillum sp.]|jgi:filamentous hemagglutinin